MKNEGGGERGVLWERTRPKKTLALKADLTPRGDSHMEQTGMLVGNFAFNP